MPFITCQHINRITVLAYPANYQLDNDVHVWCISISANLALLSLAGELLSPDEHQRAARYHHDRDRERFIVSRVALRQLLGKYLELAPAHVRFMTGDNKKPYVVANIPLYYNVAHAGDRILIAVSDHIAGVDVEHITRDIAIDDIAQTCCSAAEQQHINPATDKPRAFYQLWTRKEALLKATGKGIDDDMVHVPAMDGIHNATTAYTGATADMNVSGFDIGHDYIGSVATPVNITISVFNY